MKTLREELIDFCKKNRNLKIPSSDHFIEKGVDQYLVLRNSKFNMINKYCAFGIGYKDSQGIIIDEGEKYFVIKYIKNRSITSEFKSLVKIFDTEKEMNEWISAQGYQYDPR